MNRSDRGTSVEIFTDGACLGNPGPGGWAALLRYKTVEKRIVRRRTRHRRTIAWS